ncbi:MAG: hypothetical protein H3C62_18445, partial [Gemmatimonadaceae bacterium]|nr:hypothetical protein [Gemmatimonadaceae bacterium]
VALFHITPKVTLRARHWLLPTADLIWDKRFNPNLDRALEYALRTAK